MERKTMLAYAALYATADDAQRAALERDDFQQIAELWSVIIGHRVEATQVAACLIASTSVLGPEDADLTDPRSTTEVRVEVPSPIPAAHTGHIDIVVPKSEEDEEVANAKRRKGSAA